MPDERATRGLPQRWLLPPPPREPGLAARWAELPLDQRRGLARTPPGSVARLGPTERPVVVGLARSRLATRWRALATAPVLGWLVLMTVWGFGRSTFPAAEQAWLLAGLASGAVTWAVVSLRVTRRLRAARRIVASEEGDRTSGPG